MNKVYNVIQTSNCDGEILVNVTPCADLKSAQSVMKEEVDTLLSSGKYEGLDLDEIERDQDDDNADCDYALERSDTLFYIDCLYDDYSERIEIEEKEIVKIG
jgi:hypothetical protein